MAQTKPKAGQFYGVSNNGTDGEFLKTDGTGGMAWASPITNPTITSIDYPGSTTAADPAGGQSVIINGTLFASGITCTVGGTSAVTAFNSATQITITTPAKAAGPYTVAVTNLNGGTASENNFIQYSGVPVWSTAAGTLGNVLEGGAASFQVTATEGSDTIEYAVTTGTLPTGLSLATATGAITGTAGSVSADTTTTFSITATDDENQTSASRSFSITVQNNAPSNHFNTVLYTGNGGTQSITGLNFSPGLVWAKRRSASEDNALFDSLRGVQKQLASNKTNAESTKTNAISSFNSNGFTTGANNALNTSGQTYVSWNFKAGGTAVANTDGTINSDVSVNNTLGFSIASYTGNGIAGSTVGHGLDSTPEMVIVKSLTTTANGSWSVYHIATGATKSIALELTTTPFTDIGYWNNTSPTASVFSLGTYAVANQSSANYIAYNFTSKPGFSKVGSYTGNGSANGPIINTGFEPAWLMVKRTDGTGAWNIQDNKRNTSNPRTSVLQASSDDQEYTSNSYAINFLANGFQIVNSDNGWNTSGGSYIYLAIAADGSTATPSLANSFATELYSGNNSSQSVTTGFKPDFSWLKSRTGSYDHNLIDSVRGDFFINTNRTSAQEAGYNGVVFGNNGFTVAAVGGTTSGEINVSGQNYVSWNWKAGGVPSINTDGTITSLVSANQAAGFSVVKFTANAATLTAGHGLNSTPDLVIVKATSFTDSWFVNSIGLTNRTDRALRLNQSSGEETNSAFWNNTAPTSTTFSLGSGISVSGQSYVAYCFHSVSGYSKIGTYSGNGNSTGPIVDTGFEPSWVMIKSSSSDDGGGGAWLIYDNKRSTSNPRNKRLYANYNAAEATNANYDLDFLTASPEGFQPKYGTSSWGFNTSGVEYIYMAIKEN